jgi:hypothetical protein
LLQLGTAKVDITPRFPVPLAGFGFRSGAFERVETPLFARVFVFKTENAPPVILVSADLIWWGSDRMAGMRQRIRALSGVENSTIMLHATHTHSGPQTSEALSPLIGEASSAYLDVLENSVLAGICEAVGAVEPVTLERGVCHCDIGIHRRRRVDGTIQMAPNPEGPNDRECTVIRFRRLAGSTKAAFVHFTCHPTTTAENAVSAEFCGVAVTEIESELGNDVIVGYLQGCCGDIRPALTRDDQFYRGGAQDVRRMGAKLKEAVASGLKGTMEPCEPCNGSTSEMALPLSFENGRDTVPIETTVVRLARNLAFLTLNAEPVVEYGLFVKQQSNGAVLPLGYTNGMIGYVTTERQLIEGGYESREAFRYFGMPGPFHSSTERRIKRSIEAVLGA